MQENFKHRPRNGTRNSDPSILSDVPDDWGPKFERGGIGTALTRTGPNAISFRAPAHLALVMLTPQPVREMSLASDKKNRFLAPVGNLEIIPYETDLFASWNAPKTNVLTAIDPATLTELAGSEFERASVDLHPPRSGLVDDKARILGEMIAAEIYLPKPDRLYLDSLHIVFAMHLLRSYSSIERISTFVHRGGLSAKAWRDVNDYIHSHLQNDLSNAELANIAHLSQSHFLRAFHKTVGQSPHRYVLEQRLNHAEQLIIGSSKSLSEVAQCSGFSSHSHLATSMRRYRGISPSEIRRSMAVTGGSRGDAH